MFKLKPQAKLIVIDFLIAQPIVKFWQFVETQILSKLITNSYGEKATSKVHFIGIKDYQIIAQKTGYILKNRKNITKNVQPTYHAIAPRIIRSLNDWIAVRGLEFFSLINLIPYELLIF